MPLLGVLWLAACLLPLPARAQQTLRLASGELPPYATAERADGGLALEIVRRAFQKSGYQVSYQFLPWKRALEEARIGLWDGTAHWGKNPSRDAGFLISDNILTEQWVVLHRAERALDWHSLADLAGLRLGAVRFNTYNAEFWQFEKEGRLDIEWSVDELTGLRKLVAGRVDAVIVERNVACYFLTKHFTDAQIRGLRVHPRLLTSHFTTHLMLSEKISDSPARLAAFNLGLALLRKSGDYARLMQTQIAACKLLASASVKK